MTQAARYNIGNRWVAALVRKGRTLLHVTYLDEGGIRHDTFPITTSDQIVPLMRRDKPYPVPRLIKKFRSLGHRSGITAAARNELKLAESSI